MPKFVCIVLLLAWSASAASFDCSKAATVVEKTICATPRLSALDDELATTYAAARKNAALRDAQRKWLADERNACDDAEECIEAAYLTRIAQLRFASKSFAKQKPPARILGRYSHVKQNCTPSEDDANEYDCEGTIEDYVEVRRSRGNALTVTSELSAVMGHSCSIEEQPAEWVGDELRVAMLDESDQPICVLLLHFGQEGVSLSDPHGRCSDTFCGARAGFDDTQLEKVKKKK